MDANDSSDDFVRPAEFASLLGVKPRRGRQLLGELEALGFVLQSDMRGARLCPRPVAAAALAAYQARRDMATLRLDAALGRYLSRDARGTEPDPLDVLVFVASEQAILRETIGAVADTVRTALPHRAHRMPNFRSLGVPDPRNGL